MKDVDETFRCVIKYKTDYGTPGQFQVAQLVIGPHRSIATIKGQITRNKRHYPLYYYNGRGSLGQEAEILSMDWQKAKVEWSNIDVDS